MVTTNQTDNDVLDINGVAVLLKCSAEHVRRMSARGQFLPPARLGALLRWSRSAVLEWLRSNYASANPTVDRGGRQVDVRAGHRGEVR